MSYKKPRGQPRAFCSGEQLCSRYREFCDEIIEGGYQVLPSRTNFARFLASRYRTVGRRAVYSAINDYYPECRPEFDTLTADILVEGAALGYWSSSVVVSALKNWCRWVDRVESVPDSDGIAFELTVRTPTATTESGAEVMEVAENADNG